MLAKVYDKLKELLGEEKIDDVPLIDTIQEWADGFDAKGCEPALAGSLHKGNRAAIPHVD